MEYREETKNCQNCKQDFTIDPDDFGFYEKIKIPPPTFAHFAGHREDFLLETNANFSC